MSEANKISLVKEPQVGTVQVQVQNPHPHPHQNPHQNQYQHQNRIVLSTMAMAMAMAMAMLIIFIFAVIIYCHDADNLSGQWVLDDKGTITMNPIVLGTVPDPYGEMWIKDYWGHDNLLDSDSHKSWRPLCTVTYYWNRLWAGGVEEGVHSYYFHLVDRILHALVSALVYPVTLYTLTRAGTGTGTIPPKSVAAFLVAILFAAHPIHVEAVANSTGRAEVLCALFYFIGFCCYAKVGAGVSLRVHVSSAEEDGNCNTDANTDTNENANTNANATFVKSTLGVFVVLIFTIAAMLSKEHGITLPIMCIIWDAYIGTSTSFVELWTQFFFKSSTKASDHHGTKGPCQCQCQNQRRRQQCRLFLLRFILLSMGCAFICIWRLSKNGGASNHPDFVCEQNPAACQTHRFHRLIQFSYLWAFNVWLMLYPNSLTPDWSGDAIPLMGEHWATDRRFPVCFLVWFVMIVYVLESVICAIWLQIDVQVDGQVDVPVQENSLPTDTDMKERPKKYLEGDGSKSSKTRDTDTDTDTDTNKNAANDSNAIDGCFNDMERRTLITSFTWMLLPFLMSSNLLVYVGFAVADRTLYLPSFGYCLLLVQGLFHAVYLFEYEYDYEHEHRPPCSSRILEQKEQSKEEPMKRTKHIIIYKTISAVVLILSVYIAKQQAQTKRWSQTVLIWGEAYRVNPRGCIAGKEYGMSLVNAGRNVEAIKVLAESEREELQSSWYLKRLGHYKKKRTTKTDQPDDNNDNDDTDDGDEIEMKLLQIGRMENIIRSRFKYVTALGNAGECDKAISLIDEAFIWMEQNAKVLLSMKEQQQTIEDKTTRSRSSATTTTIDTDATDATMMKSINSLIENNLDNQAYLYVAKSRCASDVASMASLAYAAIETRPTMTYAHDHASSISEIVQSVRQQGLDPKDVKAIRSRLSEDSQTAELSFAIATGT